MSIDAWAATAITACGMGGVAWVKSRQQLRWVPARKEPGLRLFGLVGAIVFFALLPVWPVLVWMAR